MIGVDNEGTGLADLIGFTSTNVFYLDDGFSNQPGTITAYTVNPCIDSVWKQNTTVQVGVEVTDGDLLNPDLISSRAILYDNTPNEQDDGFSLNFTSGTTVTFTYNANASGSGQALTLQGRDTDNPNTLDQVDLVFNVAANGVEFGDCSTTVIVETVEETAQETAEELLNTDEDDNGITSGFTTVQGLIGIGATSFLLILMLLGSVFIWYEGSQNKWAGSATFGTVLVWNALAIVVGTRFGFFSTALVTIIVVIGIAIIGVTLGRFLMGASDSTRS